MGWNYVFQWAVVLPLELTVAGFTVGYWNPDISVGVWITVFWLAIVIINVFGVLGFGEAEFWASVLKLSAVVLFMIIGLILGKSHSEIERRLDIDFYSLRWWTTQWYLFRILGRSTLV